MPASVAPPFPLPDALPVSRLDSSDGFIHLSTALQIPGTLKQFFSDEDSVYILRIVYAKIEKDIKWENDKGEGKPKCYQTGAKAYLDVSGGVGEENMFPHLYNGLRLGNAEIESIVEWNWDDGWEAAINKAKNDSWFIY